MSVGPLDSYRDNEHQWPAASTLWEFLGRFVDTWAEGLWGEQLPLGSSEGSGWSSSCITLEG